ncbi:MAG TPA: UDP-N-acetylglucosamine 1-carboxyvinyltransferase [Candidatus Moranbacteria bacterium]|nr:UDP-N-acetylglucosamine 1-carboxyvinyltransferase [Candidatus Moranbacteria bacterium]HAT74860.1 UDP-N-acetylglucosamine 1-carboxyvinyltransferase [Candidatus Moranbacteria bacterium]
MEIFEIIGGKKLKGEIEVRGSKNATTPILAATLLTKEECVISNIPLIEDMFRMLEILESMGSEIKWLGKRKISIKNSDIHPEKISVETMKKLRSSALLLGSMSARFDKFKFYRPGGCVIGARPLGTHFEALSKMGVDILQNEKGYIVNAKKRKAAKITLGEMSVTATENTMMLAAVLPGKTIIKVCACEPHVEDLGKFLVSLGVKIKGLGTHTLEIIGNKKLRGAKHTIIPDANEAATFLIMGVATKSPIRVKNAREEHLDLVLEKLREFDADFKIGKNFIDVIPVKKLKAVSKIDTRTYPGVPSDVQAPFGVLATQAEGETLIHDSLYESRFNYIGELKKMGARAKVLDAHRILVNGPTKLKGKTITSFDLRAGATLIIAALIAEGKTIINEIYQVDRGYERIEERLQKLGAEIKRIEK